MNLPSKQRRTVPASNAQYIIGNIKNNIWANGQGRYHQQQL